MSLEKDLEKYAMEVRRTTSFKLMIIMYVVCSILFRSLYGRNSVQIYSFELEISGF